MKLGAISLLVGIYFSGNVEALNWPAEFESALVVDFPMSVGRSSWKRIFVDLTNEDPNVDSFKTVAEKVFELSGSDFFGRKYSYWDKGGIRFITIYMLENYHARR